MRTTDQPLAPKNWSSYLAALSWDSGKLRSKLEFGNPGAYGSASVDCVLAPAVGRTPPQDDILREKRKLFVNSVGRSTINALLDDLLQDRVIRLEEVYKVKDENATVIDKARDLIDLVVGKGDCASEKFIQYLLQEDPEIARKMGLC
ncbi:caspase recruitment domain-containing protein 18-like [Choloepus didactylus]|uniref:caspase recruitment domain-containing protein 18-like n=1 Tax=Choloepus didactylus TaxID=27675 RepID=UPI00189C7972|nr:caspase recruitment domain-containing protein 18-like [Choloepus didactylus]